ncbi:MAG: DUF5119 domain-containing protein [Muribaculaceae bacterium]|nr:DUF5119 domain-containing protein [Muribaculaceae bacterium]
MKSIILIAVIAAFAIISLYSCDNQPELCFDHNHNCVPVEIVFDWSACPDANPSSMNLYMIPLDGRHYTRHLFEGRDGGTLYIPSGHYAVVVFNNDCNNIKVINPENYENFRISLRSIDEFNPYASDTVSTSENVYLAPGYLWTSWINDLKITGDSVTIRMSEAFCRYSVEIRHLIDSHRVIGMMGMLSGNNQSLSFNGISEPCFSLMFDLSKNESSFYGEFLTLGHCGLTRSACNRIAEDQPTHSLTLQYQLHNGETCYSRFDVTDQIHSQATERCHIVIDTLKLPNKSDDGSGGLHLSINNWQTEYINITTN